MIRIKNIRENLSQIFAITEKHIKLKLRYKITLGLHLIFPIVSILMPLIILKNFFDYNAQFGSWNEENYYIYLFLAYNIYLISNLATVLPSEFYLEKFWKTLPNLFVAPVNHVYLLFGLFFSHLILISIPFTILLIMSYIIYPISVFTLLFIIGTYFLIALIFSGIGLIVGIFAISNENIMGILQYVLMGVFWLSCITYPFELFPSLFQKIINLNPFYYIFDFLRLIWIDNNILFTINVNLISFTILLVSVVGFPLVGLLLFNFIFKKYGIKGY
ncbi:MAG: ABC transporter permease [Candidatus Lokiarchaeia archaeon]